MIWIGICADYLLISFGIRRYLISFVNGLVMALTVAPVHLSPLLLINCFVLFWQLEASVSDRPRFNRKDVGIAFLTGFSTALGYFLGVEYWITVSFSFFDDLSIPLAALSVLAVCATFASLWGVGAVFYRLLHFPAPERVIIFSSVFTLAEFMRGSIFLQAPWSMIGEALASTDVTMQALSIFGIDGYNFIALLVATLPALLGTPQLSGRSRIWLLVSPIVIFSTIVFGYSRLSQSPTVASSTILRMVQPSILPDEKIGVDEQKQVDNFRLLFELSTMTDPDSGIDLEGVDFLIWPETAIYQPLLEAPQIVAALAALTPTNVTMITGALHRERSVKDGKINVYNSVFALDGTGFILDRYDKHFLVPYGEYIPLSGLMTALGLDYFVRNFGGFSAGSGAHTFSFKGGKKVSPLICYEIIFSGQLIDPQDRPDWIVNITNDAWFGNTSGPYQHLFMTRMRAVEEGLPVVRVANNGISAIIDPVGRITSKLDLDVVGQLTSTLPAPLTPTVFARFGRNISLITILTILFLTFVILIYEKSKYESR